MTKLSGVLERLLRRLRRADDLLNCVVCQRQVERPADAFCSLGCWDAMRVAGGGAAIGPSIGLRASTSVYEAGRKIDEMAKGAKV